MDPLAELDLNLLRTLDALLTERSVTAAARTLGRSQPAVSHALQRLRDSLDDPLLVREGREMVPTPRAEALAPALRATLDDLRRLLDRGAHFDPATAHTTFSLGCPDGLGPLVPAIIEALADAPGVSLELRPSTGESPTLDADVVLDVLPAEAPGVIARRLGSIQQKVAVRRGHPLLDEPWTVETWTRWPHVLIHDGRSGTSMVEQALAEVGATRRVGLAVSTWLLAPHVVARTDLVLTSAGALLEPLREPLGLVVLDPPIPMPEAPVAAMWAERLAADPGHRWFRSRVIAVVEGLLASTG